MKTLNQVLAFLLELVLLGAAFWKGLSLPLPAPGPALASVLLPLFIIAVWGLFAAPRARFRLPLPATVTLKAVLLGGGALALVSVGQPLLGAVDGALVALNLGLAAVWGQLGPGGPSPVHRSLVALLQDYARRWPTERETVHRFRAFEASGEPLQGKTNPRRHITASAWVVNRDRTKVLLTHHAKLGIWVQLGGHTDEGEAWADAALREAREESGLTDLRLVSPQVFDLDVHRIPARNGTPAHEHYDLRFLVEADDRTALTISEESQALAWVALTDLEHYTREASQLRMREKTLVTFEKN